MKLAPQQMFERAPGLVVILHGSDHVVEYANPAYLALLGGRDLVGRPVKAALPELASQGYLQLLDQVYRTGEPLVGRGLPTRLRRGPKGALETVYFDFVYQPIFDASGQVQGIFGQGADVTDRVRAETALRASEARFADLFGQVTVGIAQTDTEGRFRLLNDRMCEILGRSREALLDLTLQAVTHPEDLSDNMARFARLLKTGEPFAIETRYLRSDQSVVWVRNHVSLARDPEGRPQYATAVVVDISEQKQTELELQRSRALGGAVLEAALDSIIFISGDSQVVEWNEAAERTFGYSREEAVGKNLAELIIPPDQRELHHRGMARYRATGAGSVVGRRVVVEAIRKGGERFAVELAISPIPVEDGVFFAAYLRDISSRIAAEGALRESEHRLRATYEHAFVGIGEVDSEGSFIRVNEQFSAITGYSREELCARSIWDITHTDDLPLDRELFARQMAGEQPTYRLEKRYRHRDGHDVWVDLSASTVDDASGRPVYGIRVVRDVTEQRRWTERQRLLINELNHRVKNTLATVQSIAAQTERTAPDPQAGYKSFLDRLLALSGAHDVLTSQQWERANLTSIVEAAVRPFGGVPGERFEIRGPSVWLSPQQALALAMALHELATNAAKYGALSAPSGCVRLAWRRTTRSGRATLSLTWREEGGPEVKPPTRRGFGSRLLERGLAQDLGGEVEVRFDEAGVCCTIVLPLQDVRPEPGGGLERIADSGRLPRMN